MATKERKFSENVPGKFYVSDECIGCGLCSEIAPENFRFNPDREIPVDYDYVWKQPENQQESQLCAEAMDLCPANAIGDDGDDTD